MKQTPYYILHGLNGHSQENWFSWLKDELERRGEKVVAPDFPSPDFPQLKDWLAKLKSEIQKHGEGVLIGHSLGGVLAMRYVESGGKPKKVILVAAPYEKLVDVPMIDNFFKKPFKLTDKQKFDIDFTVFGSDNDPYMGTDHFEWWGKLLGITPRIIPGQFHFNEDKFPEILEYL